MSIVSPFYILYFLQLYVEFFPLIIIIIIIITFVYEHLSRMGASVNIHILITNYTVVCMLKGVIFSTSELKSTLNYHSGMH